MAKEKVSYAISARYAKEGFRGTIINKVLVNLLARDGKPLEFPNTGSKEGAPKTRTYIAATQDHLRQYYELGLMKDAQGNLILDAKGKEISNQKIVIKIINEPDTTSDK